MSRSTAQTTRTTDVDALNCKGRRLLRVTPGNVRNNHIYVRELDFLPDDYVGPPQTKA
jgi:hypothetical protein